MTHDEPTDPHIHRPESLPPPSANEVIELRQAVELLRGECTTLRRLWMTDEGEMVCPSPGKRCAALDMAETGNIGVVELRRELAADRRSRNTLTAVLGASALVIAAAIGTGGTLIVNRATAAAREQASATAMAMIRDQQRSTETIVNDAARQGALIGLQEFQKSQPVPPLVVKSR